MNIEAALFCVFIGSLLLLYLYFSLKSDRSSQNESYNECADRSSASSLRPTYWFQLPNPVLGHCTGCLLYVLPAVILPSSQTICENLTECAIIKLASCYSGYVPHSFGSPYSSAAQGYRTTTSLSRVWQHGRSFIRLVVLEFWKYT